MRFEGASIDVDDFDAYPVDAIHSEVAGPEFRQLLAGLRTTLDAFGDHVAPRLSRVPPGGSLFGSGPPSIEIDSAYVIWDDPSLWRAVTHLAQGTPRLCIVERQNTFTSFADQDAAAPPLLIPSSESGPVPVSDPPGSELESSSEPSGSASAAHQGTYVPTPAAYTHYLRKVAELIEAAPSLAAFAVKTKRDHLYDAADPRWPEEAAEAVVTLLLALRSN